MSTIAPCRVLFVCLGNICRSPCAEGVFKQRAVARNQRAEVDSCGTGNWHVGERADTRMRQAAAARGYQLDSISRQINAATDFDAFDYIVVMDDANLRDVRRLDQQQRLTGKLFKFTDFCRKHQVSEVPDPYYGGPDGFDTVIDIVEDACEGLLDHIARLHAEKPRT